MIIDGERKAPGLRFADPRVHALLNCLLVFRLHTDGFTNADLRALVAEATGRTPDQVTPAQMSYDLRRLRLHGFVTRIPGSFRYQLTDYGLQTAVAYTLAHDRVLRPGLAHLCDAAVPSPLRAAFSRFAERSCLAA